MNNRIIQLLIWLLFSLLIIVGTALVQHRFCCTPQDLLSYAEEPIRLLHLLNAHIWAWVIIGVGLVLAADRLVHAAWNFVLPVLIVGTIAMGAAFLPDWQDYLPNSTADTAKALSASVRGWSVIGLCYLPLFTVMAYLFARRSTRLLICTLISIALWIPAVWGCEWLAAQWAGMPEPPLAAAMNTVQACPWLGALLPGCTLLLFCELMSFYEAAMPATKRCEVRAADETDAPQATTTPPTEPPAATAGAPAEEPTEAPAEEASETPDPAPVETPEEAPAEAPAAETVETTAEAPAAETPAETGEAEPDGDSDSSTEQVPAESGEKDAPH